MANIMTKRGQQDNIITYEHICDTKADLNNIKSEYITLGTVAIILHGESGLEVYMADSNKEWVSLLGVSSEESTEESYTYFTIVPKGETVIWEEYNGMAQHYFENIDFSDFLTEVPDIESFNARDISIVLVQDNDEYILTPTSEPSSYEQFIDFSADGVYLHAGFVISNNSIGFVTSAFEPHTSTNTEIYIKVGPERN